MAAVWRTERSRRQASYPSAGRGGLHCNRGMPSGRFRFLAYRDSTTGGDPRDHRGARSRAPVGHHVCSLSQGLSKRNESGFFHHGLRLRRNRRRPFPDAGIGWRHRSSEGGNVASPARAVLAFSWRVLLDHRRSVPTLRGQVYRSGARHSSFQYESDLGTGLGDSGVRRNRRR